MKENKILVGVCDKLTAKLVLSYYADIFGWHEMEHKFTTTYVCTHLAQSKTELYPVLLFSSIKYQHIWYVKLYALKLGCFL